MAKEFDADKAAAALMAAIGDNSPDVEPKLWLDMGYAPLNKIISGDPSRGFPAGRMGEIAGPSASGKTLLATLAMIATQRAGGIAIFIDWEQAFSIPLAEMLGLNTKFPYFVYKRVATWEEGNTVAMKTAEAIRKQKLIDPDAPITMVCDSIAASVPKSMMYDAKGNRREIDEYTMHDTTALARVTSTTLKSINQLVGEFNVAAIYLNQIRTKPGVVYGDPRCLRGDTMIPFVDGTTAAIEDIVKGRISKQVWSYNEATGQIEPRAITGWHDNGSIKGTGKQFLHIRAKTPETANGVSAITVTNDHKVLVFGKGWVSAEEVNVGDKMLTRTNESVTVEAEVTEVREAGKKLATRMYDITVEGNHNFLAGNALNGVVVHNCTPGGGAMEFYASWRLFTGRKKIMATVDGEKEFQGALIGLETVKNKLTRPFQNVELRLMYDKDGRAVFDFTTGYIEELIAMGKLEEKAGRVTWEGKTYFKSVLAKKIDDEGLQPELIKLYLS